MKRRREWKFLTSKLTRSDIPYKWGYPFKLLVEYKEKTVVLTSIQQAKKFEALLAREEVDIEVLNQRTEDQEVLGMRNSAIYRIQVDT